MSNCYGIKKFDGAAAKWVKGRERAGYMAKSSHSGGELGYQGRTFGRFKQRGVVFKMVVFKHTVVPECQGHRQGDRAERRPLFQALVFSARAALLRGHTASPHLRSSVAAIVGHTRCSLFVVMHMRRRVPRLLPHRPLPRRRPLRRVWLDWRGVHRSATL